MPSGSFRLSKNKDQTGVVASKAKGLRSIEVELTIDQATQSSQRVSPASHSLSVLYYTCRFITQPASGPCRVDAAPRLRIVVATAHQSRHRLSGYIDVADVYPDIRWGVEPRL